MLPWTATPLRGPGKARRGPSSAARRRPSAWAWAAAGRSSRGTTAGAVHRRTRGVCVIRSLDSAVANSLRCVGPVTSGSMAPLLSLPVRHERGESRREGPSRKRIPPLPGPLLPRASGREGEKLDALEVTGPKARTESGGFSPPSSVGKRGREKPEQID